MKSANRTDGPLNAHFQAAYMDTMAYNVHFLTPLSMAAGAASAKALLGALPNISAAAVALPAAGVSGGGPRRAGSEAALCGAGGKGARKEQRKGDANAHANPATEICWRFNRGACTG